MSTRRLPDGWKGAGVVLVCTGRGSHPERRLSGMLWDEKGVLCDWGGRVLGVVMGQGIGRMTVTNKCPRSSSNTPLRDDTLEGLLPQAQECAEEGQAHVLDLSYKH